MPANHIGITEGTVGRNINELDFPHFREGEQDPMPFLFTFLGRKGPTIALLPPPRVSDKQELTHSACADPGLTVGHSTTSGANCCHTPWEACLAKQNKSFLSHYTPWHVRWCSSSVERSLIWQTDHRDSWPQHKPQHFPWFSLCSLNSRTMSSLARWPGKCSIKQQSFAIELQHSSSSSSSSTIFVKQKSQKC